MLGTPKRIYTVYELPDRTFNGLYRRVNDAREIVKPSRGFFFFFCSTEQAFFCGTQKKISFILRNIFSLSLHLKHSPKYLLLCFKEESKTRFERHEGE